MVSVPRSESLALTQGPAGLEKEMDRIEAAVQAVRQETSASPDVGVILGTGLGGLADGFDFSIAYEDLPHFPVSTVESHSGRLHFGMLSGRSVVVMQGRFHLYEGYSLQEVVLPIRVMGLLGVRTLVVSAACGGMNPLWSPGDLVLLEDHINLLGENPLTGPNLDSLGPRFPDMSEPYSQALQGVALAIAAEAGIPLRQGVYVSVPGPNLETRAEYRMLRAMGADVVGMSTVPEVIAARHMGMDVLGLAIITDQCLPDALQEADVSTIIATAMAAEPTLTELITRVVGGLDRAAS